MNKKQYNNIIMHSLQYNCKDSKTSLDTARIIFDNMGVALPVGTIDDVCEILKTDDYMGWRACTIQEAQAAADRGQAAIGISNDRIVVLSATDEEEPIQETAAVMFLSENTPAYAVSDLSFYSYNYGTTCGNGGSTTIFPPYVPDPDTPDPDVPDPDTPENVILDKPYDPNYPYINIRTAEQYYTTLSTYSYELRNDIVFQFTYEEIHSMSMYLNMQTYRNSSQQEREKLVEDIISFGLTAISVGVNFVPIVGQYFDKVLTALDIAATISGLNRSTVQSNIENVCACINAMSHYIVEGELETTPKPNNVTYTVSLLKTSPNHGREIKIESSDGIKDIYTIENTAYDMLLATAIANAHQCSIYKIAPQFTYYWEDFNVNI